MKNSINKLGFFSIGKIAFLAVFLLFSPLITYAGFGISPGLVVADGVLRGSSFEKIFVISRSDPVEDLLITVQPEGEIASWFQFERGAKFTYPAGNKQFPIKTVITVPKGTPNGTYSGNVRFTGSPQAACTGDNCPQGSTISVALGALADISITVTDQEVKGFRVVGIQIDKAVEGEPLVFALFLENLGNVRIQPDHLIVDIFDKFHKIQLGSFTVNDFEGWAPVQNSGRITAKVPYAPESGNLWGEISIFDHQNQLVAKESIAFDVKIKEGKTGDKSGASNTLLYIIIGVLGGGLLSLFLGFVFFTKYLKRSIVMQGIKGIQQGIKGAQEVKEIKEIREKRTLDEIKTSEGLEKESKEAKSFGGKKRNNIFIKNFLKNKGKKI